MVSTENDSRSMPDAEPASSSRSVGTWRTRFRISDSPVLQLVARTHTWDKEPVLSRSMPYLTLRRKARLGKELSRFVWRVGGNTLMEGKGNWCKRDDKDDQCEPAYQDSSSP